MNNYFKKFIIFSLLIIIPIFVQGYGYMGDLPEIGKNADLEKTPEIQTKEVKPDKEDTDSLKLMPLSIIVPRALGTRSTNKYNSYLSDTKQAYFLLKELKTIVEKKDEDNKAQLFCAKVNYLHLYIDSLKDKYNNRPEKNYDTYKQLIVLDKYLTQIVDYRIGVEKYKEISRGTLENEIADKKYLDQKINNAIIPINTVIGIINEAN